MEKSKIKTITFSVYSKRKCSECFDVNVKFMSDCTKSVNIQFPLFNFSILKPNAVLRSNVIKELCGLKKRRFVCSNNGVYLQTFSFTTFPVVTPSNPPYFQVHIRKGRITITGPGKSFIAPGPQTFNSQSIHLIKLESLIETTVPKICEEKLSKKCLHRFKNNTVNQTLSVLDANAFILTGLDFPVNIKCWNDGNFTVVRVPSFSFTITTIISPNDYLGSPSLRPGGFIKGTANFLPRPEEIQTNVALNGKTPSIFNVSIDTYGFLFVASNTQVGGVIDPGTYTLPETTFCYLSTHCDTITPKNIIIDPGFTNITQFSTGPQGLALRDFHVNDIFNGVVAFVWPSNASISDKTNNTLNVYARTGTLDDCANINFNPIVNISGVATSQSNETTFNQSIGINRMNPNNMAAVFGVRATAPNVPGRNTYTSYSNDQGITWSTPNLLNTSPVPYDAGDLIADKYGNFWIVLSDNILEIKIFLSSDGGQTWTLPFTIPLPATDSTFDFPTINVGNNGLGNYGVYVIYDEFLANGLDVTSTLVFITVTGLAQYSNTLQSIPLNKINQVSFGQLAITPEGTVLIGGLPGTGATGLNYYADTLFRKTLGVSALTSFEGPKTIINTNQNEAPTASIPSAPNSYFIQSEKYLVYDSMRKVTYSVFQEQALETSQDIYLFMVVSFNEGNSWSRRFPIASTHLNNRGFSSIRLDSVTGAAAVGWQDSRNSPDSTSLQYFGTIISSKELDAIVCKAREAL